MSEYQAIGPDRLHGAKGDRAVRVVDSSDLDSFGDPGIRTIDGQAITDLKRLNRAGNGDNSLLSWAKCGRGCQRDIRLARGHETWLPIATRRPDKSVRTP